MRGVTPASRRSTVSSLPSPDFARGVHPRRHGAQLGDGLDQARQQAGVGGSGDEEEGTHGLDGCAQAQPKLEMT